MSRLPQDLGQEEVHVKSSVLVLPTVCSICTGQYLFPTLYKRENCELAYRFLPRLRSSIECVKVALDSRFQLIPSSNIERITGAV
jgi:hypothetical protein